MDKKVMSTILEGYSLQQIKDLEMPVVSKYLCNYSNNDMDFLMDLAMYSSDTVFMKRKYKGPLEDLNQLILDNKELLISRIKDVDDYRSLRNLLARDFELSSSIQMFLQYKQIYQVDSTFLQDLIRTQYDTPNVPLSIFKHLPYQSFYLDLQNTDINKYLHGAFISVQVKNKQLKLVCQVIGISDDSNHPASEGYFGTHTCRVLLDCNDPDNPDNNDEDVQIDWDAKQFNQEDLDLDIILQKIHDNWPGSGLWDMCFMWYVIVPFLMYLNSDKADIKEQSMKRSIRKQIKSHSAPIEDQLKTAEVGYVYGCTVRKHSASSQRTKSDYSNVGSQTKRSHMRRAHWHRYRCGKNRQDTRLVWMPPLYIQGNSESAVTIHKVE